ncbi:MAG TPA: helix-turn-helix domain-containing protein [Candidatus Saccharimonadia bacterium]|nr:helix-turn-helix domain-containing protein [Candidatus Saccharimonadia bacterium]
MYAIDRGNPAGSERPAVGLVRAGTAPHELASAPELLRRHGERWTVIEGRLAAPVRALHAPGVLWIARRGSLTLVVDGSACVLESGRYAVTEPGARIEASVAAARDAGFVALAFPARCAARIAQRVLGIAPAEPVLFAALGEVSDLMSRDELDALDHAFDRPGGEWALAELCAAALARLVERQHEHAPWLARTSGRTDRHRRHLYARLNRVRLAVGHGPARDYTMRELADVAHLSVWHFVRSFGHVYGETPHRYLTRVRLEAAARALRAGDEAIAVVAERHGYDNRCAFARLFRSHFGVTASQYRRGGDAVHANERALKRARADAVQSVPAAVA